MSKFQLFDDDGNPQRLECPFCDTVIVDENGYAVENPCEHWLLGWTDLGSCDPVFHADKDTNDLLIVAAVHGTGPIDEDGEELDEIEVIQKAMDHLKTKGVIIIEVESEGMACGGPSFKVTDTLVFHAK